MILCCMLSMACSTAPVIVDNKYVRMAIPDNPPDPDFYPMNVQVYNGYYCFDEDDFRGLVKNIDMMRTQREEFKAILDGLRTQATQTQ